MRPGHIDNATKADRLGVVLDQLGDARLVLEASDCRPLAREIAAAIESVKAAQARLRNRED